MLTVFFCLVPALGWGWNNCAAKEMCVVVTGTYCTDLEDWDLNLLNSPGAVHSVPSCNTQDQRITDQSGCEANKTRGEKARREKHKNCGVFLWTEETQFTENLGSVLSDRGVETMPQAPDHFLINDGTAIEDKVGKQDNTPQSNTQTQSTDTFW